MARHDELYGLEQGTTILAQHKHGTTQCNLGRASTGPSWAVLGLRAKPVGQPRHDTITCGPFSPLRDTICSISLARHDPIYLRPDGRTGYSTIAPRPHSWPSDRTTQTRTTRRTPHPHRLSQKSNPSSLAPHPHANC